MPSTRFDSAVSGSGSASWSSAAVLFVSCDITTVGLGPRIVDDADHIIRAGWFSLGDSFDIGLGTFDYWRLPIWVDFVHFLWTPIPSDLVGGAALALTTTRIRWHFESGVIAHLHVFG